MMLIASLLEFLTRWLASAIVIFVAICLYPSREKRVSFSGALLAALLGSIVYTFFYMIRLPLASLLALFVWLFVIKEIFDVGWIGAGVIAALIYLLSILVSLLGISTLL